MTPAALSIVKLLGVSLINLPLSYAAPLFARSDSPVYTREEPDPKSPDDPQLWVYLSIAIALVLLGGVFAGLTIALMGQDEIYLQVIATSGEGSEKKSAARVLRLLKKGKHWVLVTLLLSNVITNETLPIVLDRSLGGGWPAVLSSTVLIGIYHSILYTRFIHTDTNTSQSSSARSFLNLSVFASVSPLALLCHLLSWASCGSWLRWPGLLPNSWTGSWARTTALSTKRQASRPSSLFTKLSAPHHPTA
jgi:hypothetical protein